MSDSYAVLRSTDGLQYFSGNQPYNFKVSLGKELILDETCVIALAEIHLDSWLKAYKPRHRELYIYCNVVTESLVGNRCEDILRRVHLNTETSHDEGLDLTFSPEFYVPTRTGHYRDIEITIKDAERELATFLTGTCMVTLHIKHLPFFAS
jgi:hypothetical protein